MNVTVILVAYHGDRWLPDCLSTLVDASAHPIHLVLVDNSGNTQLGMLDLDAFDYEIIRTPRPLGFAEANNYALASASRLEKVVLFLNQDTLSRPEWIDRCTACFIESERLGAISPVIRTYDWKKWDIDFLAFVAGSGQLGRLSKEQSEDPTWFEVTNAPAPALLIRTDVLKKTGPFDPIYGSYYEDADLCMRVRREGFAIGFCRTGTIAHFNGSTTTDRTRELARARQVIRNRVIYQLRESEGRRWPMLLHQAFLDFPRRLGRGLLRTASSQPVSATLKAFRDLLGLTPRLLSQNRDRAEWQRYLQDLGWPDRIPGLADQPAGISDSSQLTQNA